jgi:hypothetical protein
MTNWIERSVTGECQSLAKEHGEPVDVLGTSDKLRTESTAKPVFGHDCDLRSEI